jgi:hypothetical protein
MRVSSCGGNFYAVAADPILNAILDTPSDNSELVVAEERKGVELRVNAPRVLVKLVRSVNATSNGPTGKELRLHFVCGREEAACRVVVSATVDEAVVPEVPTGVVLDSHAA